MDSEPQPFSWPGSAAPQDASAPEAVDPAQAAADAAAAGHQQGFDRGYAEGLAKAEQDNDSYRREQIANIDELFAEAQRFTQQWRAVQVELVALVGAKFMLQELVTDSQRLQGLLDQALQLLPALTDFTLACHPQLEPSLAQHNQYKLVADEQLEPETLELRQGSSCLQLDMQALVNTAFANLEQLTPPLEGSEVLESAESQI